MALGRIGFILHIVAAVFSIIELGLTAYIASTYDNAWWSYSPSQINFMIFNSVWSLLVLGYLALTPLYYPRIFDLLASLIVSAITTLFWFAGSIALAVAFGGLGHCGLNTWCGSVSAAIAFGFFLFVIFLALTILDALEFRRSRGHSTAHHTHTKPYVGA